MIPTQRHKDVAGGSNGGGGCRGGSGGRGGCGTIRKFQCDDLIHRHRVKILQTIHQSVRYLATITDLQSVLSVLLQVQCRHLQLVVVCGFFIVRRIIILKEGCKLDINNS